MMKSTNVTLIAIAAALLLVTIGSINSDRVSAADAPSIAAHGAAVDNQAQPADETSSDDSERIDVQVWTLMAAGGAAALGLVLLGVRITLGWVKPPPEQEDAHH